MRTAAELFDELREKHEEALECEGDNLLFVRLAIRFPETAIGVASDDIDGLSVLSEALKVGGVPIGYVSAVRRFHLAVIKWSPLDEFRDSEVKLGKGTPFLNAITEVVGHELKLPRAHRAR
jgi:hypothetical protein